MDGLADYFLADPDEPAHGTLQLVVDVERAGGGLVTINVKGAHAVARALGEVGIELIVDDTTSDPNLAGPSRCSC